MQIDIDELVSTVHAIDGETVLAPSVLREIVRVVGAAIRQDLAHERRTERERRLAATPESLGEA